MPHYCVTRVDHAIAEKLQAGAPHPHLRSTTRAEWVDAVLDARAPFPGPKRSTALYAFDNLNNCVAYSESVGGSDWRFFEVILGAVVARTPWHLTSVLTRLEEDHPQLTAVIEEYWRPTRAWSFWEFLTTEMTIRGDVTNKVQEATIGGMFHAGHSLAMEMLGKDIARANELWPSSRHNSKL